jgi:pimeloyl-ACP methyl ester carboxylesterase
MMTEPEGKNPNGYELDVPLDHSNPDLGLGSLYYEFGQSFEKEKPTLFVIVDAQQFFIREGEVANFQKRWFGDGFNVLGITGRNTRSDFIQASLDKDEKPDWKKAWQIFNHHQWLGDIEAVRKHVLGKNEPILIYGESGGGMMAHQYLAEYGQYVSRAFTRAVVHPYIVGQLGLNSDRFWKEVGNYDPSLHKDLKKAMKRYNSQRSALVMTLQRQNFYVTPDEIGPARAELIQALAKGDDEYFQKVREEYAVDDVNQVMQTAEAIPIRVRLFEFLAPSGARERISEDILCPDYEVQINISEPLIALANKGEIMPSDFPFNNLHKLESEVFVLSGRWDHVVDYRSSIALAANYPKGYLFIAEDSHVFSVFEESGLLAPLLQQFLLFGLESKQFKSAVTKAAPYRWQES